MTQPDDRKLLHRATLGDRGAFEAFVSRHQASVYRLLRAMSTGDADAEDALQEAFLAAWRSAGGYRGGPSARGWMLAIARDALRGARRRRAGAPADSESPEALGRRAGWGSRDRLLDALARREILALGMSALDPADREILVLRDLEGLEAKEVAEMLGVGLPAMKRRLHRARLRLVAALREVVDERA